MIRKSQLIKFKEFEKQFTEEIAKKAVGSLVGKINMMGALASAVGQVDEYLSSSVASTFPIRVAKSNIEIVTVKDAKVNVSVEIGVSSQPGQDPSGAHKFYRFIHTGGSGNISKDNGIIFLELNGTAPIGAILENQKEIYHGIRFLISHEMTHIKSFIKESESRAHRALDDFNKKMQKLRRGPVPSDAAKDALKDEYEKTYGNYLNQESEFKARLREIIEYISVRDIVSLRVQFSSLQDEQRHMFIKRLLMGTPAWTNYQQSFTSEHKRQIMVAVYKYLTGTNFVV